MPSLVRRVGALPDLYYGVVQIPEG